MDHLSGSTAAPVLLRAVRSVDQELMQVRDVDPTFLSVPEKESLLVSLVRIRDQIEGLLVDTLTVAGDVAEAEGARSAGAWLAAHTHQERPVVGRLQRLADDLVRRPALRAGLRKGRVSARQATVIAAALDAFGADVPAELAVEAERHLVELAGDFDATELRRLGAGILEVLDPATYEDHERARLEEELRKARAATRLSIRSQGDGTARISGVVPESVGARLRAYLHAFSSPRHDAASSAGGPAADRGADSGVAASAGGCGGEPSPYVDPVTGRRLPGERVLGEAFCAFLEAADPGRMPIHGGAATTVIVTMDFDKLRAEAGVAATGSDRLTAGEVRRLACHASIIPAVLGGASEVLDLGRGRRLFSPPQRKALALRFPTCCVDGCDVPASWCEAHHLRPWARGGRTDLADGVLACPRHHHLFHDDRYEMTRTSHTVRLRLRQ